MKLYFRHRARGQAMAEFALLLPVLLLLTLGIFEFGRAYYSYSSIANAAREAARYGVINPTDKTGMRNAGINTAIALGLSTSNFLIQCLDDTTPSPNISDTYCNFPFRVRVTVTYSFTAVVPLIPSFTMTSITTMRIE